MNNPMLGVEPVFGGVGVFFIGMKMKNHGHPMLVTDRESVLSYSYNCWYSGIHVQFLFLAMQDPPNSVDS
jgi:NADH:ubiquinone oxidoreductase subunit H